MTRRKGAMLSATTAMAAVGLFASPGLAVEQTMGLFLNDPGAFDGYTLFTQLGWPTTYLIDNNGDLVHSWDSQYPPGNSSYLLENGHLLRASDPGGNDVIAAGGDAGLVEEFDWDGNLLWSFLYSNDQVRAHHDIALLPNGNVLILAWELKTIAEAVASGRDPSLLTESALWPEHVIEVEPVGATGGNIVWEWHLWDHLIQDFDATKDNFGVVSDHPELVDINYVRGFGAADWIHANAIDYHPGFDQIMISCRDFSEFWIIDHSTTSAEAAGHTGGNSGRGGDVLYRWGNPRVYGRGTEADQQLYGQHDTHWIPPGLPGAGNILIFNNGLERPQGMFSEVEEIVPPVDKLGNYLLDTGQSYGPAGPVWSYTADPPEDLFSSILSGAQRQPNGNTLICAGPMGDIFEVTPDGDVVWRYVCPISTAGPLMQGCTAEGANRIFRAPRYAQDYAGFAGRDLTPRGPIELPFSCDADLDGDLVVGFGDLTALLGSWGSCAGCPADLDGEGNVGFQDLTLLLAAWGPCC